MDKKQKAIAELKKQIKLGRQRLGEEGIRELEKLAKGLQKTKRSPASNTDLPPDMVPYDKKAAAQALEIFLKNHGDSAGFQKRLQEMLRKSTH